MKRIIISLRTASVLMMFVSCSNSAIDRIERELKTKTADSLVRIVPDQPDILNQLRVGWVKTLGVPALTNGSSNFQIRIWEDLEGRKGNLYMFKFNGEDWKGELYKYKYHSHNFTPDSLSGERIVLSPPKSGWNNFVNELLDFNILKLPDYTILQGYEVDADANFVTVEIANKNYYRVYDYPDPQYNQTQFPEAKKILQILELIRKEFKLK